MGRICTAVSRQEIKWRIGLTSWPPLLITNDSLIPTMSGIFKELYLD